MKLRYLLAIGLFATVFFFVYQFPAGFVATQFTHPKIKNFQPIGTIWNAKAERVLIDGILMDAVHFGLKPLSILSEQKTIDFALLFNGDGKVAGTLHTSIDAKSGSIEDTVGIFELKPLLKSIGKSKNLSLPIALDAMVQTNIAHLNWEEKITKADGVMTISKIQIDTAEPINAQVNVKINMKKDVIRLVIDSNKNGALDVSGQITIQPSGAYQSNMKIAKTEKTPQSLANMLLMFNISDNRAGTFNHSGNLSQLF